MRISADMNRELRSNEGRERLNALGLYAMDASPEEFGAVLRADYAKYARIVKEAKIRID